MSYDSEFDQARLDQLADQYLADRNINGQVFFFSESEGNRLDNATWRFEDDDHKLLKASGFKIMLMELLDTLLIYRGRNNQPNASQGVVEISGDKMSIEWLPKETAEALRYK